MICIFIFMKAVTCKDLGIIYHVLPQSTFSNPYPYMLLTLSHIFKLLYNSLLHTTMFESLVDIVLHNILGFGHMIIAHV